MNEVSSNTARQQIEQVMFVQNELFSQSKYSEMAGLSELFDSKMETFLETPTSSIEDILFKVEYSIDFIDSCVCDNGKSLETINKAYHCIENNAFVEAREILNNLIADNELDDFVLEGAIAALKDLNQFH